MSMLVSIPFFDQKINGIINYINSQNIVILYNKEICKVFHSIVFNKDTTPNKVYSIYINCEAYPELGQLERKIKENIRDLEEITDKIILNVLFNDRIPTNNRFLFIISIIFNILINIINN